MRYSKTLFIFLLSIIISSITVVSSYPEFKCIKCHSKKPGARAMHDALKGEDCFGCHVRGEKLRQKGGIPEEKHQAFLKQRLEDSRCIRCHKMEAPGTSTEKKDHPSALSGRTYCPKCQVIGGGDWKMCPKCGGNLLNLDKLIRKSALHPDQALCRKCHVMEGALEKSHVEKIGQDFSHKNDCLDCHQGHTECSDCHK